MNEFFLDIEDADGNGHQIKFNDVVFDYVDLRSILNKDILLNIIATIKEKSAKKVVVVFGNCQAAMIRNCLLSNKIFSEQYFLINIPAVCDYSKDILHEIFQEDFWSLCDLFISQRIKMNNAFNPLMATHIISMFLPETSKIVLIPNVYFDGYFPQHKKNLRNVDTDKKPSGRFPAGDKYIDAFLDGGGLQFPNSSNTLRNKVLFQNLKCWIVSKNPLRHCKNVNGLVIFICWILLLQIISGRFFIRRITQRKM